MKIEDSLLYLCCRQCLSGEHRRQIVALCAQSDINWSAVYATADQHGVAPLIYTNLKQCDVQLLGISNSVIEKFEQYTIRNIALQSGIDAKLGVILDFFDRRNIDIMLVKGVAMDLLVYAQPWYTYHDIDIVIGSPHRAITKQEYDEIAELFSSLQGFEYDFFEHHDVIMNGVLAVDFNSIWRDARLMDVHNQPAWVMSPEDMLLAACINCCRKRFFRLKSLLDIAELIACYPDLNWSRFVSRANTFGCGTIVYTSLLVTQLTVGANIPDAAMTALVKPPVRRRFLLHLIRRMLSRISLMSAYPFSGVQIYGRNLSLPLLLTYASYQPEHIWRKAWEIIQARYSS